MINTNFNSNFACFTNFELWEKAIEIIETTIKLSEKNRHFNTISIDYYKKLKETYKNEVKSQNYYDTKIKNFLFYGYNTEFFSLDYLKPKTMYSARKVKFLSYPMLAIHNMIIIYLYNLLNPFYENYIKKNKRINSFYGGNFSVKDKKFYYKEDSLYYYNQYLKYKKMLYNNLKEKELDNIIVLRIDIQDYYNSISIPKFLNYIDEYLVSSRKIEHSFDEETKKTIVDFFSYLMNEKNGVPAIEQSALNNFLGYFYLCFADIKLDNIFINDYSEVINNFNIIRYVDDTYIFIELNKDIKRKEKRLEIILDIFNTLRDIYFSEFNLVINDKTKCFDLSNEENINLLKKEIKITSQTERTFVEDNLNIEEKYKGIFHTLKEIKNKNKSIEHFFIKEDKIDISLLNEIYNKAMSNYLDKPQNKEKIQEMLKNISLSDILFAPKPLLVLLYKYNNFHLIDKIKQELLKLKIVKIEHVEVILEILSQENFNNSENLISKAKENQDFIKIIECYENISNQKSEIKYIDLFDDITLINQLVARKKAILSQNYALALNHLINEFQLYCFYLCQNIEKKKREHKNYTCLELKKDLSNNFKMTTDDLIYIEKAFDKRNINQISHSVSDKKFIKNVSKTEYLEYEKNLENILEKLKEQYKKKIL